jgi:hypothetical protein
MRIWLRWLGLTVVCVAAVVASFSTLASLAEFTGWAPWASWLLPLSLDALGMTACLVWLDPSAPKKSRRYAAWMTWIAAGLSVVGNGTGHLVSTGHLAQGLLLVVLVGSVPPAALAVTVHLIVSVSAPGKLPRQVRDTAPAPALPSSPAPSQGKPKTQSKPRARATSQGRAGAGPALRTEGKADEVEIQRARHADREYRAANGGKPISRIALKNALGVGTEKATVLLAELKKEEGVA